MYVYPHPADSRHRHKSRYDVRTPAPSCPTVSVRAPENSPERSRCVGFLSRPPTCPVKKRTNRHVTPDGRKKKKEIFYLTTHSTHFIYGVRHMEKDHSAKKKTRCRLMGYSFRLAVRVLLYASSHRPNNTYHGLCYTSRGALAGTRNSSMGSP